MAKAALTQEYLEENYIRVGKSVKEIQRDLDLHKPREVVLALKRHGIPVRSLQEAKKVRRHVDLARATSLERYGVEWHLQKGSPLVEKGKQTSMERYGTDRPCQSRVVKDSIERTNLRRYGVRCSLGSPAIREKARETNVARYGVDNPWKNPDVIRKCQQTKAADPDRYTQTSHAANSFFDRLFETLPEEIRERCYYWNHRGEFGIMGEGRYHYYDFTVTGGINLIVEFNGDYYHANPRKYDEEWANGKRGLCAREIWELDRLKHEAAERRGFKVIVVWESDDLDENLREIRSLFH